MHVCILKPILEFAGLVQDLLAAKRIVESMQAKSKVNGLGDIYIYSNIIY